MKYICVTEVDAKTKIPCTIEPQRTGPSMPDVKGLKILWTNRSKWPVSLARDGTYLTAPEYYGTCDDDADVGIPGVLAVLTEGEWLERKNIELLARKPYPSWILVNDEWVPPFPRPADAIINGGTNMYGWDERVVNWRRIPPRPADAIINGGTVAYDWDEETYNWKPL